MEQGEAAVPQSPEEPEEPPPSRGVVVVYEPDQQAYVSSHERATRNEIARQLAALKGFDFVGDYDPSARYPGPVYFVPSATLVGVEVARRLGIRGEHDLFGGVVPHSIVATKAISHPLVEPDARAPAGWSHEFGERVRESVLSGYSVFTREDARYAGARLLADGPVRVKPVRATGGRGQSVVSDAAALDSMLDDTDAEELAAYGLVLEENLGDVTTYSVGQVRVAELVAAYHGTQRLTPDNNGEAVYGGSDLTIVRGGFDALLGLDLSEAVRRAVAQARAYDDATELFPGLFVSRRNYDIAEGVDHGGRRRFGVLEQSWRLGGASSAEIAALEAFRADPALRIVRASSMEIYGGCEPPPDATIYFRGVDERVGPITKYSLVKRHGDT